MTANIPPKQTVTGSPAAADPAFGQPYAAPSDPPGALVSIHNAALHANPDSFPVLKAFQDYLETERQRARQRLILLSAFFAVLLITVIIGLIGIGVYLFGNMSETQGKLLAAVLDQRAATPIREAVPQAQTPPSPASAAQQPALDPETLARLVEERVAARLAAAGKPPEPAATEAPTPAPAPTDLDAIKAALATLKQENEELRAAPRLPPSVGPIVPRSAVPHLNPAAPPADPVASDPQPPPPAPEPVPSPVVAAAPTPPVLPPAAAPKPLDLPSPAVAATYRDAADRLTLEIPPRNGKTPIPWRIVLPPQ